MSTYVARKMEPSRIPAGTQLDVRVGRAVVTVEVLEDLGPLGSSDGRHVLHVMTRDAEGNADTFNVTVDPAEVGF